MPPMARSVPSDPKPNYKKWQIWLLAARPKTLPAAISPVLVGTALAWADGQFSPAPALAAVAGALLLQILSNFANDYFDFTKGADTRERLGPTRVMAAGLLSARDLRIGMAVAASLAVLIGIYLILGWRLAHSGGRRRVPFGRHIIYWRTAPLWLSRPGRPFRFPLFRACRRLWNILRSGRNAYGSHSVDSSTGRHAHHCHSGGEQSA